MKSILIFVFAVGLLLTAGCATIPPESNAWEYRVMEGYVASDIQKRLNDLGNDGWIVVSSSTVTDTERVPRKVVIILKRQK